MAQTIRDPAAKVCSEAVDCSAVVTTLSHINKTQIIKLPDVVATVVAVYADPKKPLGPFETKLDGVLRR